MGVLVVSQIHLKRVQAFYGKGRGTRRGPEVTDHHRHLGASRVPRKAVLVDVSWDTSSCKFLINNTYFPYLLKPQS